MVENLSWKRMYPNFSQVLLYGTYAHYDAYFVKIPIEFFPKELIKAMERHFDKKQYEYPMKQFVSQISLVNPIEDGEN